MFQTSTNKGVLPVNPTLVCSLLLFLFLAGNLHAKSMETIQIFFPGNFCGRSVSLTEQNEPLPTGCWKAPSLIEAFLKNQNFTNIVIGAGNDSSIYSLPSFLSEGKYDRGIIDKTDCSSKSVGPEDLLIFRNKLLSTEIRQRIVTNIEPENEFSIFPPYRTTKVKDTKFWVFNFIGSAGFDLLPLQKWGLIKPEDPSRSIRRINPQFSSNDVTVSIAHMTREECLELAKELNKREGIHLIAQISGLNSRPAFSTIDPEKHENVFIVSLCDGWERLPMIKIVRRNFGYPRLSIRLLPYEKAETSTSLRDFAAIREDFGRDLYSTLGMIPTTLRPSTAPFRFHPDLYAGLVKTHMSTDIAIIKPPQEKHKTDNVISVVDCLSCFENEKLFRFRISGADLIKLIGDIVNLSAVQPSFSGCSFSVFAGRPENILIGKYELRPENLYNVSINSGLLNDRIIGKLLPRGKVEPFDGTTLWDVWKIQLKSLKIEKRHLMEL